jgi:membrane protein
LVQRLKESRLGQLLAKYGQDQADDYAVLIAFSALFSLFPLIGALLTLLGLVIQDPQTLEQLIGTISQLFPAQLADLLGFLEETRQITGLLGIVSFVGLLWSASNLFGTMARAFNHFYGLTERGFIGQRLMAFGMIFVFLLLVLVSVLASSVTTLLVSLSTARLPFQVPGLGPFQALLGWGISLGSAFLMFLAVFRIVPNGPLTLRHVWRGALLSAVLFVLINQIFPLYLQFFGGGFATYKTLGLFLLLMTWFYLLARILVLGCELNALLLPLPKRRPEAEVASAPLRVWEPREQLPSGGGFKRTLVRLGAAALALLVLLRLRRH